MNIEAIACENTRKKVQVKVCQTSLQEVWTISKGP